MTLQDRAAQWLLTVEETWKGTTGPLTYDPDARYIKGPDGLDVTGEHRDDDEQAGRDYRAFAAAPTHLSEGQALVRELLAEVERLTDTSHCPECGCQGSVRGFCQTCDLKTDRDCLLDKVARLEDRIVELVHEREDSPPPADAALLALANRELLAQIAAKDERIRALEELINHPEIDDWLAGVRLEAAHQQERWGADHDAGKTPADWFWLVGYLAGKALHAAASDNDEKAMHHTISTGAALLNWHAAMTGRLTSMRPGIDSTKYAAQTASEGE